ncbi:ABC transporter permease subunit [Leptolyngbya sp. AN03gr2]|uniref:ABC transporter permease subunit n=1 Tax=unclassified Leptolyngbya TaxID=2650499 RepID=UPI003D31507F
MTSNSLQSASLFLGFVPFFRKELQEWKQQKQVAIAILILIPFALSVAAVLLIKLAQANGTSVLPPGGDMLTLVATSSAKNSIWIAAISILLSIGLIPNEQASGTLAWNLTKPLSRLSFLLGKGLSNTIVIWIVAVVLANAISLVVFLLGVGGGGFSVVSVLLNNLFALLPIAFWVLFCMFAGMFLKDQAAIGAFALIVAVIGTGISSAQGLASSVGIQLPNQEWIRAIATYYPTNVIDGFLSETNAINFFKLGLYLIYMTAMAIATYWMFDRKEFS